MRVTSASVVSVCASIGMVAVSPAWSQQSVPGDLPSAVAATRAAEEGGRYVEAFRFGIAALDTYPEEVWNRDDLDAFYNDITRRFFMHMSREDQRAAVASVQLPPSAPAAQAAMLWARWMSGQTDNVWDEGWALFNRAPNSFGAGRLIEGCMQVVLFESAMAAEADKHVMEMVKVAPENPETSWALCVVSWLCCAKNKWDVIKSFHAEVVKSAPSTLAATTAEKLARLVNDVQAARYDEAFAGLATLGAYWRKADTFEGDYLVQTFLTNTTGQSVESERRAARLRAAADKHAIGSLGPEVRDFAVCVKALLYERQGKRDEAKTAFQRVLDDGAAWGGLFARVELARMCTPSDPQRAIRLLEQCRAQYLTVIPHVSMLGRLYLLVGDYSKGLEAYTLLENLRIRGQLWVKGYALHPRTGIMLCLNGLGQREQALALANQLLQESRYETGLAQMSRAELDAAAKALEVLHRPSDAAACLATLSEKR